MEIKVGNKSGYMAILNNHECWNGVIPPPPPTITPSSYRPGRIQYKSYGNYTESFNITIEPESSITMKVKSLGVSGYGSSYTHAFVVYVDGVQKANKHGNIQYDLEETVTLSKAGSHTIEVDIQPGSYTDTSNELWKSMAQSNLNNFSITFE